MAHDDTRPDGTRVPVEEDRDERPDLDEPAPTAVADLVRLYLDDIGRTPLLSAADEVDLARRIEAGVYAEQRLSELPEDRRSARLRAELEAVAEDGRRAKTHMLQANLRLVVSVAKKYAARGLPFLDVVQEGNLGLVRAVEKFDYAKGFKFSTYATWWIRQAITRGLAEQSRTVRLPVHVHEQVGKLRRTTRDLALRLGRDPSTEELAEALELPVERVIELRRVSRDPVSLDTPVGEDGDTSIGDLVVDVDAPVATEAVERQLMRARLREAVDSLPAREALIVRLRFGLEDGQTHTLEDIASHVHLTRERVRQLERDALVSLRSTDLADQLLDWAS
jgi:RNA polymerase primary sigma factor